MLEETKSGPGQSLTREGHTREVLSVGGFLSVLPEPDLNGLGPTLVWMMVLCVRQGGD